MKKKEGNISQSGKRQDIFDKFGDQQTNQISHQEIKSLFNPQ